MGVRTMAVLLRNCGSVPYEVNGYPGIQLHEDQQPIEVTAWHESPDPR